MLAILAPNLELPKKKKHTSRKQKIIMEAILAVKLGIF